MPQLVLYHGTSRDKAELIRANGFKPSAGGCLGAGVYVAHHDKAFKFAANCPRHEGDAGVVVKVKVTFSRAKYVRGDDQGWRSEGFDACRAEWTSASTNMEWCLASPNQVEFLAIQDVPCGAPAPAFELSGFEEVLSLDAVRRLALAEGMEQVFFSERDKVVSFVPSPHSEKRFNVFYATGTVGIAYGHPKRPQTQCFQRKADMQILGELFRASSRSCGCHDEQQRHTRARYAFQDSPSSRVAVGAEEAEVRATLEQLRKETEEAEAILREHQLRREEQARREAEAKRREKEERRLEEERKRQEEAERRRQNEEAAREAERQRKEEERSDRGRHASYFVSSATDVSNMFDEKVTCVSTNGVSTIFLYENGGWAWTSGLPKLLHNKLNGRARSLPSPAYVAIGSLNRYYIRFADGKSEWVGPDSMGEYIKGEGKEKGGVATVAFGDDYDTFFLVYNNGGWRHSGNIPAGLVEIIGKRDRKGDLECVSLGSGSQWYLEAKNGRKWWGGLAGTTLEKIGKRKNSIKFLDFGTYDNDAHEDDYFLRYS